jgi:hypothetical protein
MYTSRAVMSVSVEPPPNVCSNAAVHKVAQPREAGFRPGGALALLPLPLETGALEVQAELLEVSPH